MIDRPWRPAWAWLALAGALLAAAPLLWLWSAPGASAGAPLVKVAVRVPEAMPAAARATEPLASAPAEPVRAGPPQPPATARHAAREPNADGTPDLADVVNPGEKPTMAEVIARLQQAGITTGLAAFQAPGTRPPLIGLAVPEDFPLPPGYVRHHQATDDGQRIEAILMFAPGLQLYDTAGRPVPMPADRVVPPELAPPGLPIRRITVPAPIEPGR